LFCKLLYYSVLRFCSFSFSICLRLGIEVAIYEVRR